MNDKLLQILQLVKQSVHLGEEEKKAIVKAVNETDRQLSATESELARTEHMNYATSILFAETVEELGQKRKTIEAQNRELEIEAALERVRARTMAMQQSKELSETTAILFQQMNELGNTPERLNIGIIKEDKGLVETWATEQGGHKINRSFNARLDEPTTIAELYEGWKDKRASMIVDISGNKLKQWIRFLQDELKMPVKEELLRNRRVQSVAYFKQGFILVTTSEPLPAETISLLERFAEVFNLTYTRFLDLQKAETQAREAEIELGLERVRARAMAMQNSVELNELIATVFNELTRLDLVLTRCVIQIYEGGQKGVRWWMANSEAPSTPMDFFVKYADMPFFNEYLKAFNERSLKWQYILEGENKIKTDAFLFNETELSQLPDFVIEGMRDVGRIYLNASFNNFGNVTLASLEPLSEEHFNILLRFAKVFDLTYTRFNDIKQAEAQAREAQIEASLERVRSRSLAMHKSDELTVIARIMFEQLRNLGLELEDGLIIMLFREDSNDQLQWPVLEGLEMDTMFVVPYFDHPVMNEVYKAKETGVKFIERHFGKAIKDDFLEKIFSITDYKVVPVEFQKKNFAGSCYHYSFAMEKFTGILMHSYSRESYPAEYNDIIKRFARVFEQAYIRFLDLQNAEAQAREAHIEASLERVRSKTMAMHSSDDVSVATATMFTELERLGIENFRGGITNLLPNRTQEVWSVNNLGEGKVVKAVGTFDIDAHPFWRIVFKEWEAKKDFLHYFLAGDEKEEYIKILNTTQGYLTSAIGKFPDVHFQVYYFNEGAVFTNSLQPHSDEDKQTMKRFSSVFSLTFRRYQDLKKAEAQAREAKIEAALERVRAKAMAMQSSDDVSTATTVMFNELYKLGIETIRCGILIIDELQMMEVWSSASTKNGQVIRIVDKLDMTIHPLLQGVYESWKNEEKSFTYDLNGRDKVDYYWFLANYPGYMAITKNQDLPDHFCSVFFFEEGGLYTFSLEPHPEEHKAVLEKFTAVFSLTFRRYQDLKNSEANAKEAVKQAALDRIRADIASMRKVEDLDRITPLIWNELTILGIPFIRCGVFIMDDVQELIHTFLSAPDGKAIAAFHLPYDTPGNLGKVVSHWREKKNYIDQWSENEFINLADMLVNQGAISGREEYLSSLPQGGFHLHFLPFLQGMLYVGNATRLNEEEIKLLQSVAGAFSTAYARYEDFNKLEAAKKQVDSTLNQLKATQKQLILSEKMASLGELTAGIAHEIQNPLNFVNNFSELNKEMADEATEEIDKGNYDEAKNILNDFKSNLEKILRHGKRADAIVKGMLQHSRVSTGHKEPTDINALCDEYLRLAYHGLRAKDKSFDADFKTDFDESIEKINVVPQDMGRVLLNLFNNAFYAVNEKKQKLDGAFDPAISVSTKRENGSLIVKVADNGNGIPQNIIDKIFQPFFTTKPTGNGTGLGLSLSYDVIKTHGGEIRVETKEEQGSEFIIVLPA